MSELKPFLVGLAFLLAMGGIGYLWLRFPAFFGTCASVLIFIFCCWFVGATILDRY